MEEKEIKYCPKCGSENDISSFFCSTCGYNFTEEAKPKKSKKKLIIFGIIFAIIAFLVGSEIYVSSYNKKVDFHNNCINVTYDMLDGAAESETCCNEICNVWHHSIWKVDDTETNQYTLDSNGYFYEDFNDALSSYSSSTRYKNHVTAIQNNYSKVTEIMNELRNSKVPSEYSRLYDDVEDLYDLYIKFCNIPLNMNGSYNTFSDDFKSTDNSFMDKYQKVISYFN